MVGTRGEQEEQEQPSLHGWFLLTPAGWQRSHRLARGPTHARDAPSIFLLSWRHHRSVTQPSLDRLALSFLTAHTMLFCARARVHRCAAWVRGG